MATDPRRTRAWRRLRDRVVSEEPVCKLQYPGICTYWSQTADHIVPVRDQPDLAMHRGNLRGACHACNRERGATPEPPTEALAFFQ